MYCEACGGWDRHQGGTGHRLGCPVGASGHSIGPLSADSPVFRINDCIYEQVGYEDWLKLPHANRNVEAREEFSKGEIIFLRSRDSSPTFILKTDLESLEVMAFSSLEEALA